MSTVKTPVMTDVTGKLIASALLASSVVPADVTIDDDGDVSEELVANSIYHFTGDLSSLTITFASSTGTSHYTFDFTSGLVGTTLTLPAGVVMPDDFSVKPSRHYEIDIVNNYGVYQAWSVSS